MLPQTPYHGPRQTHSPLPGPKVAGPPPPVAHSGAVPLLAPSSITPNAATLASFSGLGDDGYSPSDANTAAGPSDLVEVVNAQLAFYSTTNDSGTLEDQTTFAAWFGVSGTLFDPRVVYDYANGHFIMLIDTGTSLLVSVSQQNYATGTWCDYTFPTVSGWADAPRLGVSSQGIFFSVNIYANQNDPNSFTTSEVFAILGTGMEKCRSNVSVLSFTGLMDDPNTLSFSVVPVVAYFPFVESNVAEYFVDSYADGGCSITRWFLNPKTKSLNTSASDDVTVPCYSPPTNAPQAGSSIPISTGDNRLSHAIYGDWTGDTCVPNAGEGTIDLAMVTGYDWGDGLGTVAIVSWYRIDAYSSGYGLMYSLSAGYPGSWYFYPAESPTSTGAIMVFDFSNSSSDPNIGYVAIGFNPNCGGPYFEGNTTFVLAQGQSPFTVVNSSTNSAYWGDYQSAYLDPNDLYISDVWVCGQYAAYNGTWGTQIAVVSP